MGDNPLHEEDTEQLLTQIPLGSGVHLRLRMGPEPSRSSILQAETLTKRLRLIHGEWNTPEPKRRLTLRKRMHNIRYRQ